MVKKYKDYYVITGTLGVAHYSDNPAYSQKYLYTGKAKRIRKRFKTKEEAVEYLSKHNL